MKVDVILPTHNRAHLLERSIQSVLKQTYPHYNLYIVDDGSTDHTSDFLKNYQNLPHVFILSQLNKGVSAARNLGIRSSHSPWIAFLDSDDEWMPQKLERQMELIKKNPHLRFFHSNEIWVRNEKRVNPPKKFDKSSRDIFRRSLETCLISPSTVIMRRELSEEKGHFDEEFVICEDYDLWLKILSTEEVGFSDEYLITKYGGHEDQLSTRYPAMDYWRLRSLAKLALLPELNPEKRLLVLEEIKQKAPILLSGYLKHQKLQEHQEIMTLVGDFIR